MADATAIDLFSGCGGTTLGLQQAGLRVLAAVEIDDAANEAYRRNHPSVRLFERDIRRLRTTEVMRATGLVPGELTILAGCPPCQGFSTLRTRRQRTSVPDDRNDLIADFARFVRSLRPAHVLMENVPGLAGQDSFGAFLRLLDRLGYTHWSGVVDAAQFGVAQRRRRLLLAATRVRSSYASPPPSTPRTVREVIGALPVPGDTGDAAHDASYRHSKRIARMIAQIPRDGGSRKDLPKRYWLPCHQRSDGYADVYGRMRWDDVSPTVTSGCLNPSKGRFLHPEQNRAISAREAALLQGFPLDYYFPMSVGKERVAAMIGNALPPPLIMAHAAALTKKA